MNTTIERNCKSRVTRQLSATIGNRLQWIHAILSATCSDIIIPSKSCLLECRVTRPEFFKNRRGYCWCSRNANGNDQFHRFHQFISMSGAAPNIIIVLNDVGFFHVLSSNAIRVICRILKWTPFRLSKLWYGLHGQKQNSQYRSNNNWKKNTIPCQY